jgi:hypothetical protein
MKLGSVGCLVLLATLFAAIPSHAISCRQWDRMGPDQKAASIDRMIDNAVAGSGGRQYQINRGAVARCMNGYAQAIQYNFDDACADSRSAGMQALNKIFKEYIWTCAG